MTDAHDELERIHRRVRRCTKCRLHETRQHAVPGEGPADARCMFIGEAPGAREDEVGSPFVGLSGRFLDEALAEAGRDRSASYITSVVKCRPPGNRNPRPDEFGTCIPAWLRAQIEIINPEIIVILGGVAFGALFEERAKLADVRGQVRERDGRRWLITYHPASAMRFPTSRAGFEQDLRTLAGLLGE